MIPGLISSNDCLSRSSSRAGKVVIKTAPKDRLDNERRILKHFQDRPCIRQMLDEIQDPLSLVLRHLDDNLLSASNSKRLERQEIKYFAKKVLEALQAFHEADYVHTGTDLFSQFLLCCSLAGAQKCLLIFDLWM
jgi:casein kinase II subunit alpha